MTPVIFNHSATIDDFVATTLLTTMPDIDLKGIVVTSADCLPENGMQSSWKLHQFLNLENKIPLSLSNARAWNPFPWSYKQDNISMGSIDSLKNYPDNPAWPPYPSGEKMLSGLLKHAITAQAPVKLLVTGPLTTIANVLSADIALLEGIDEIIWMGGAINVEGNLDPTVIPPQIANKHAEWNAFWDPFAVETILGWVGRMRIFPLDITNQAHISQQFMQGLQQQENYPYSKLVYEAYSLVIDAPYYEMWNTLTACYLAGNAGIFQAPVGMGLRIVPWGFEQGWINNLVNGEDLTNMQYVYLEMTDVQNLYNYLLARFRQ